MLKCKIKYFITGNKLVTQIVPIPTPVRNIPGRKSDALYELVFYAIGISPLGYQSFFISENEHETEIETDGVNEIDKDYYTKVSKTIGIEKDKSLSI